MQWILLFSYVLSFNVCVVRAKCCGQHTQTWTHIHAYKNNPPCGDIHPPPLLRLKQGQSYTHSTANERGSPRNQHLAVAWSNQWLHVCSSKTHLLMFNPPQLSNPPPHSVFLSICWTLTPSHRLYPPNTRRDLLNSTRAVRGACVLSVSDKEG